MLSITPQTSHQHQPCYSSPFGLTPSRKASADLSLLASMAIGSGAASSPAHPTKLSAHPNSVAQALEIARDSTDGAADPTVCAILDSAIARIWASIQAQPDSYIMTRDEFAVFNYFQNRFTGNVVAQQARKRYWENTSGP